MLTTNEPTSPTVDAAKPRRPLRRRAPYWRVVLIDVLIVLIVPLLGLGIHQIYVSTTCAGFLSVANYAQAVHLQPKRQSMTIQAADRLDGGAPATLVQVRTHNPQKTLDMWVFGCTMLQGHPRLVQLFAEPGLTAGIAEMSSTGTLITATLDTSVKPEQAAHLLPFQQYLSSEYGWRQGHFVPLSFPGFYPVTSRLAAEALQEHATHTQPWSDPVATAVQMSRDLLHWNGPLQASLVSKAQTTAQVEIDEENPQAMLQVSLQRLSNLWLVTGAHAGGMILTRPGTINQPFQTSVTSPIRFSGAIALIDGQTTVTLLDHTLAPIATATLAVQNDSTYAGVLAYPPNPRSEPGVLLIESMPLPQNYGSIESGQLVMTSVLLH